ncbi:hypothetical protein [Raoultella planticola]|uniref:hypothetical protein n=1 Tax=Raoultella planticola TaxID=575 RepID=UPI003A4E2C2A
MSNLDDVKTAFIDTFISPVKGAIEYRAKNNFFGSLAISWTIWNWEKIAYFLYSNDVIITKINNVTSTDFLAHHISWPQWMNYILKSSVYPPLIFAILFTLSHPIFTWGLSLAHKRIMNSIYNFNVDVESSRQDRKEQILTNALKLESIKNIKQSETDRTIAENNAKKAESDLNASKLREEYIEKERKIKEMDSQILAMKSEVSMQESRKRTLAQELNELTAELYPFRMDKNKIDELHNYINKLNEKISQLNDAAFENDEKIRISIKLASSQEDEISKIISNRSGIIDRMKTAHEYLAGAINMDDGQHTIPAAVLTKLNEASDLTDTNKLSVYR